MPETHHFESKASSTSSLSPHVVNWKQTVCGSFNLITFPFRSMTDIAERLLKC